MSGSSTDPGIGRVRWNLKHLGGLIAVLAVSFALVGVGGTAVVSALAIPAVLVRPDRRGDLAYWMLACYPLLILLSVYSTWFSAWLALGHLPRESLDDPGAIRACAVPMILAIYLGMGLPIAFVGAIAAASTMADRRARARKSHLSTVALLILTTVAWFAGFALLAWDPFGVLYWIMD